MAMSKALVGIDLFALCNAPRFHRRVPAILFAKIHQLVVGTVNPAERQIGRVKT